MKLVLTLQLEIEIVKGFYVMIRSNTWRTGGTGIIYVSAGHVRR